MNYSIAIIGLPDMIQGFKAIGVHAYAAGNAEETLQILKDLKKNKDANYAIIFVAETFLSALPPEEYKKIISDVMPAVVPVPDSKGSKGFGFKRLTRMIEQAVGSDIFGGK